MISKKPLEHLGLDAEEAERICAHVQAMGVGDPRADPVTNWSRISQSVLRPDHPFAVHEYLCEAVFGNWDEAAGPRPLWIPSPLTIEHSNLRKLQKQFGLPDYQALRRWSVTHRESYWQAAIEALSIRFRRNPSKILDLAEGVEQPRWLCGARLNIVESCFQAEEDAPAILFDAGDDRILTWSYGQLGKIVNRVANGLKELGFGPDDPIAVDLPMIPESVAIYLGIIHMGGVVVSIADSFAAPQIASRLKIAGAKAIFTMGHISKAGKRLPLYQKVIAADPPLAIVLDHDHSTVSLRPHDLPWEDFLGQETTLDPHVGDPHHPINVLFSSGTTGDPKAIPWDHTTAIKSAADGHYHHDIHPGDVIAWPTNLGWMMGPWLIFAALINRAAIALYGDAPTGRAFGRFVQDAEISMLGLVPSLVRQWRQTDCMKGLNWSRIRAFSSTGECSSHEIMFYLMHLAGYRPVIEYCGGTEIGGGYITNTVVQPCSPGTFSTAALGSDFVILNDQHCPADVGELFLIPPSMGLSRTLLNKDHHEVYFKNTPGLPPGSTDDRTLRRHGDQFERIAADGNGPCAGYFRALGRADDTMNLAGVKVGSAEVERVLNHTENVRETAAVAVTDPEGGPSRLVVFAVLDDRAPSPQQLRAGMQQRIRQELNPLFKISDLRVVDALPRTASNKVMRRKLRAGYVQ